MADPRHAITIQLTAAEHVVLFCGIITNLAILEAAVNDGSDDPTHPIAIRQYREILRKMGHTYNQVDDAIEAGMAMTEIEMKGGH